MKRLTKILACMLSACAVMVAAVGCGGETPSWIEQMTCNHEWDDGKVTTEPTCTQEGKETITCEKCGKTKTAKVAKAEHNEVLLLTRDVTCEKDGEELYECKDCGELRKEIIESEGHSVLKVAGKEATCTEEGVTDGAICKVCEAVLKEQKTIEKKAHDYGADGVCEDCGAEKPAAETSEE